MKASEYPCLSRNGGRRLKPADSVKTPRLQRSRLCDNKQVLEKLIETLRVLRIVHAAGVAWQSLTGERISPQPPRLQVAALNDIGSVLAECREYVMLRDELIRSLGAAESAMHSAHGNEWANSMRRALARADAVRSNHEAEKAMTSIVDVSKASCRLPNPHPAATALVMAAIKRDPNAYHLVWDALASATNERPRFAQMEIKRCLLTKLAPALGAHLSKSVDGGNWPENAFDHIEAAWNWSRARSWLQRFQKEHDELSLPDEHTKQEEDLGFATTQLASLKAWQVCVGRLNNDREQKASLGAWKLANDKIGKGGGKYAETHRRTARQKLQKCRNSIPSWIMPRHRVVEQIDMLPESFDVLICDEASQTGPEGLLLPYLAKQCIIVGDNKQISPEAIGVDREEVMKLMRKWLPDFPHYETLYPEHSLFDQAAVRYGTPITLTEHFRCMPEIIRFSNDLSYAETPLIPLRQYPPERLAPIQVRHVIDGFREGSGSDVINRHEALALVDTVAQCINDPHYRDKTMGVITLQGNAQAKLIEGMILESLGPKPFDDRRLVCGNAYSFQGDERDVIFLSMVAAVEGPGRFGALVKATDRRRFNVAASRARDQMWLFHSVRPEDCHPECMRRRLLEFFYNPVKSVTNCDLTLCDSDFERDVAAILLARQYRLIPQFGMAGKKNDFVVEGLKTRLAVECDGDRWHGAAEYERDMFRQRMLERCGLRFAPLVGCLLLDAFYFSKDVTPDRDLGSRVSAFPWESDLGRVSAFSAWHYMGVRLR